MKAPPDRSAWSRLLLVPALAGLALLVAQAADTRRETMLLLLGEPLLWVFALWAVYDAVLRRDGWLACSLLLAMTAASAIVRLHPGPLPILAEAPAMTDRLRACAHGLGLPAQPLVYVQWHPGETVGVDGAEALLAVRPDLVALVGPITEELAAAVEVGIGGEARRVDTPEGPVTLFTAGVFHACGDSDVWSDAPVAGVATALAFAGVAASTSAPLLVGRLPDPLREPDWGHRAEAGRARLAALADGLASSLLIVGVDGVAPAGGSALSRALGQAGLVRVSAEATWPARLLGAPWPFPLHPFDQVWASSAWRAAGSTTFRAPDSPRLGVAIRLEPAFSIAVPTEQLLR